MALVGEKWTWLETVDRTNLELASGKPVLQKSNLCLFQMR